MVFRIFSFSSNQFYKTASDNSRAKRHLVSIVQKLQEIEGILRLNTIILN